ncbi:Hemerythrin [Methanonatronarchaeum thermophilum]|uniref:Hemerythrin n=1 Tax=Methanonatronarchaeum thermophilum TaxID=1927129 RepID=A0A1Y3GAK0_9EURY|nr:bacteriohemerythrin [Methanonatronarchaeum thermophilum]OUJ18287.1 Hemerythrin [Methanonatronarchaeum thermophilum]
MGLVEWDSSYSVGIKEIDEQHKKLFSLFNELHGAMRKGRGSDKMSKILMEMKDYTEYHFSSEEELMEKYDYPEDDLKEQIDNHEEFVEKLNEFIEDHNKGKLTVSVEVLNFLTGWLKNHIKSVDTKMRGFFENKEL